MSNQLSQFLSDPEARLAIKAASLRQSFGRFVTEAWKHATGFDYVHGRHIEVLVSHLEAVAAGKTAAMPEPPFKLKPGTRLMREWNGTMYSVLVTADGFDFAGRTWSSLTMIARQITGSHQSGPRFFGLKRAKRS